jgi:hypothetical protein
VVEDAHAANSMINGLRKLALDPAVAIYAGFRWNDPPRKAL